MEAVPTVAEMCKYKYVSCCIAVITGSCHLVKVSLIGQYPVVRSPSYVVTTTSEHLPNQRWKSHRQLF